MPENKSQTDINDPKIIRPINSLLNYKEQIVITLNAISAIALVLTRQKKLETEYFLITIELLNFVALVAGLYLLSGDFKIRFKRDDISHKEENGVKPPYPYAIGQDNLVNIEPNPLDGDKIKSTQMRVSRVNLIIPEFLQKLKGFTIMLLCLYLLMMFTDASSMGQTETVKKDGKPVVNVCIMPNNTYAQPKDGTSQDFVILSCCSCKLNIKVLPVEPVKQLFNDDSIQNAKLQKYHSFMDMFADTSYYQHREDIQKKTVRLAFVSTLENVFNLFSSAFLYLAFLVLYKDTLDENNNPVPSWKLNYWIPFALATLLVLFNITSLVLGFPGLPLIAVIALSRVISGLYNSVAMVLLFSRFISMEYLFNELSGSAKFSKYYYTGALIFLPLYAVVQPLWGIFDTNIFSDDQLIKSIILLLCFWGKMFFFLFIYYMLDNGTFHRFLYYIRWSKKYFERFNESLTVEAPKIS